MERKLPINYHLISFACLKLGLIGLDHYAINSNYSYDKNKSLEILHAIHAIIIIYYNASFYSFVCVLSEFFLGLMSCCNWQNLNTIQKIYSIISLVPTVSIWIFISSIYIYFNYQKYQLNKEINRTVIIKKLKMESTSDCPICLDKIDLEGFYICSNKHVYHQDCINKWINSFNKSCPNCREKV